MGVLQLAFDIKLGVISREKNWFKIPLIHGQIKLTKFIESNKFDHVSSKIWHIFVWSNQFDQILEK